MGVIFFLISGLGHHGLAHHGGLAHHSRLTHHSGLLHRYGLQGHGRTVLNGEYLRLIGHHGDNGGLSVSHFFHQGIDADPEVDVENGNGVHENTQKNRGEHGGSAHSIAINLAVATNGGDENSGDEDNGINEPSDEIENDENHEKDQPDDEKSVFIPVNSHDET